MRKIFYFITAISLLASSSYAAETPNEKPKADYSDARVQHDIEDAKKLKSCIDLANKSPDKAYDMALDWRVRYGGLLAEECLAMVNIAREEYSYGAKKLFMIASATDGGDINKKSQLFTKAGNAFLMAEDADNAKRSFDSALELIPQDANSFVDRARAYAMMSKWEESEKDLTQAMKLKGELGLALRLRAETRLQQKNYAGAEADINRALELEPKEVDNYLVRGRVREAKRLGHAPE